MTCQRIEVEFVKTYATEANAVKAAEAKYGKCKEHLRYIVVPIMPHTTITGMRYGIAFLGQSALQNMVHHSFNVLG